MAVGVFVIMAKLGRLGRADAAAFAAHYGSASAVTFAAALAAVQRTGAEYEGFLPVLLVILEIPAILVAIFLHRLGAQSGRSAGYAEIIHEVALNRSVFLLLAGIVVGAAVGPARFEPFEPLFVGAFKPILAFFVLEMGLLAAHRLDLVGVLPLVAVAVVLLAGVGVVQHLVGGVDLLEARLGLGVAGVHIGVVLACEAAEGSANLLVGGVALYAEDAVEVVCHASMVADRTGPCIET